MEMIEEAGRLAEAQRQPAPEANAVAEAGQGAAEFLSFNLGGEEYGIDILKVQEIRSYAEPTRIPGAPADVKGVINLRGIIVPIVDLRLKFGHADPQYDGFTVVIVLNVRGRVVGMVVDSVSDVVRLDARQIKPAPSFSGAPGASFIRGIGLNESADDRRLLILIEIENLLSLREMGAAEGL